MVTPDVAGLSPASGQTQARSPAALVTLAPGNVLLSAKHTGLDRDSVANVSQLVTIDKGQLTERVGKIPQRRMEAIFAGIDLIMGR